MKALTNWRFWAAGCLWAILMTFTTIVLGLEPGWRMALFAVSALWFESLVNLLFPSQRS